MALYRGAVLFCLWTLLFSSFFMKDTKGTDSDFQKKGCGKGSHSDKGNLCQDKDDDGDHFDDDIDDTYKIVNNIKISLSSSGDKVHHVEDSSEEGGSYSSSEENHSSDDGPDDLDMDHNDYVSVMGHWSWSAGVHI